MPQVNVELCLRDCSGQNHGILVRLPLGIVSRVHGEAGRKEIASLYQGIDGQSVQGILNLWNVSLRHND